MKDEFSLARFVFILHPSSFILHPFSHSLTRSPTHHSLPLHSYRKQKVRSGRFDASVNAVAGEQGFQRRGFIIAFDDLTNDGYELKAIDEGKTQEGGLGQSGGVSSYYYFQKMSA